MNFKLKKSNSAVQLMLVVFVLSIASQAYLNHYYTNSNQKLSDERYRLTNISEFNNTIVGKLYGVRALFYELVTSDGLKKRELIHNDMNEKILDIKLLLSSIQSSSLDSDKSINAARILVGEKLTKIQEKINTSIKKSNLLERDLLSKINTNQIINSVVRPFNKIIEISNNAYYNADKLAKIQENYANDKKQRFEYFQLLLLVGVLFFGSIIFYGLTKTMNKNNNRIKESQDYVSEVLEAQPNIIVVNDGSVIQDASGGFFKFFSKYKNIDEFLEDHTSIAATFVTEDGYIQRYMNGTIWVEYMVNNPDQEHRAKIIKDDKVHIFKMSCVKSKEYRRFIVSMFDITESEESKEILRIEKENALRSEDHFVDILDAQPNIIIINDGTQILDASGGFFKFFDQYKNIAEFSKDYSSIADHFIKEDGCLQRYIGDDIWVEHMIANPDKKYKAKMKKNGKTYTYQVSCVKSKKYQRFIVSMFDITN